MPVSMMIAARVEQRKVPRSAQKGDGNSAVDGFGIIVLNKKLYLMHSQDAQSESQKPYPGEQYIDIVTNVLIIHADDPVKHRYTNGQQIKKWQPRVFETKPKFEIKLQQVDKDDSRDFDR